MGGKTDTRGATQALAAWLGDEVAEAIGIPTRNGKSDFTWFFDLMSERKTGVFPLWAVLCTLFVKVPIARALREACDCPIPVRVKARPKRLGISARDERFESARTKLSKLWPRRDLSIIAISRLLETSSITVIRWAAVLDLPFPRLGPTKTTHRPKVRGERPQFAERVRRRRREWLEACKLIPRGAGAAKHPATKTLYAWLTLYDRQWLQRQLRARRSDLRRKKIRQKDLQTAGRVLAVAKAICQSEIPQRASATAIMRALGRNTGMGKKQHLRKTYHAAMAAAESCGKFTPRKLRWLHDNGRLSRRTLSTALRNYPEIKQSPLLAPILHSS